jgi:hypothetical protein
VLTIMAFIKGLQEAPTWTVYDLIKDGVPLVVHRQKPFGVIAPSSHLGDVHCVSHGKICTGAFVY